MTWRIRGGALVVVLSCLAACSGGSTDSGAATSTTSSSLVASQETPGGPQGAGNTVPGGEGSSGGGNVVPGQTAPGQTTPTSGGVTTTTAAGNSFPLKADVSPKCVTTGMVLTVTLTTRPHSSVAVTVAFSDGQSHGGGQIGTADGQGHWTWRKAIAPDVPLGPAQAIISAQDRSANSNDQGASSTGEGGTLIEKFEVKRTC